jgi:hypothetical protein
MGILGQATMLEVISALVLLFVAFYFIFKPIVLKTNWQLANLAMIGRDLFNSLDYVEKLYNASFSNNILKDFISKTSIANESIIISMHPEETIKDSIIIATNCTRDRINKFTTWYASVVINRRVVNIFFIPSNLTDIPLYSDLLIICNYINLTLYRSDILNYLSKNKGIIEISDLGNVIDDTTKEIFGIDVTSPTQPSYDINISTPINAYAEIYYPYKFFYNVPIIINATSFNQTSGNYIGNFTYRNYIIPFEIDYNSKFVYFITSSGVKTVRERESFTLENYNFFLSYILSNTSFSLSFKKVYNFTNFRGNNNVILTDGNEQRIFLYEASPLKKIPVSVLNTSKVAWIADFDRDNNATHDQKLALLSLILTVSNKNPYFIEPYSIYKIPYLNVESYDMYEVYRTILRISYP